MKKIPRDLPYEEKNKAMANCLVFRHAPAGVFAQAHGPEGEYLDATGHGQLECQARTAALAEMKRHLKQHERRLEALQTKVNRMRSWLAFHNEVEEE